MRGSSAELAGELGGITRNSVIGKVHRLGLTGRAIVKRAKLARHFLTREEKAKNQQDRKTIKVLAVRKAYKYTLDMALRECDEAYALAMALGQASVMVSAVTVKAKIAGLVIDKKEVTHGVLDDLTTKELLRIRATLKREREPVQNGAIEMIEDKSDASDGKSGEGGATRFRVAAGAPSTLNRD